MRLSSLDAWRLRDEAEPRAGRHPLERVASVVKRLSRPRRSVGRTWSQFSLERPSGIFAGGFFVATRDGQNSDVYDAVVRLRRARDDAPRLEGAGVRRGRAGRGPGDPSEAA